VATALGKLEPVDPRSIWQHEAGDFTPWLLNNADRLADALGIELELETAEYPVGGYKLDLVGRDLTNDAVLIVENQLEGTDHSHLGQVLTYAAGTAASTIIWVATAFRPEHRQALDWLNENTGEQAHFFGIEIQVVKIGDSPSAPLFNVVVQPNDWQKQVRAATQSGAVSERGALYMRLWERLLARVQADYPQWSSARKASPDNWIEMKAPIKGCKFSQSFAQGHRLRHELYIDTGDADRNLEIFESLPSRKAEMEQAYGRPLTWEELPTRRACRVANYKDGCDVTQEDRFEEYIDWFIDAGTRLRKALSTVALPD
jgi:Domain of unknown function (DUF4268)